MKKSVFHRFFIAALMTAFCCFNAFAGIPQVQVKVILISVSGDSTVLTPSDPSAPDELTAPVRAEFISELVTDDGKEYVMFPQWTIKRELTENGVARTSDYLKRQEAVTTYEFTDNGKFYINFAWSYREKDATETIAGADVQTMDFTIDNSELTLYNAFSPNDDGINDVYKIYAKSIVNIKIAIFNRWGQTIKTIQGRMEDVLPSDAEPDNDGGYLFEIWDGRFNGDVVNDGVYFINVQATGAGGKKYDVKSDINVLKGTGIGN